MIFSHMLLGQKKINWSNTLVQPQDLLGFSAILSMLSLRFIDVIVADVNFLQLTKIVFMILAEIRSNIRWDQEIACEFD